MPRQTARTSASIYVYTMSGRASVSGLTNVSYASGRLVCPLLRSSWCLLPCASWVTPSGCLTGCRRLSLGYLQAACNMNSLPCGIQHWTTPVLASMSPVRRHPTRCTTSKNFGAFVPTLVAPQGSVALCICANDSFTIAHVEVRAWSKPGEGLLVP